MTSPEPPFGFAFDNSYARDLQGFYVEWQGARHPDPQVIRINEALARELGLDPAALATSDGAKVLTGAVAPAGAQPLAMAYAGHQFGGFSPQLGDGRALLLGEVLDQSGARRDIHLKGSGRTPFSRGGDGKAALGPVLREYLMGEAMQALHIPTTRALAACTTGEQILRDSGPEQGAVLARVAASHLRVGTFQFFAARGENDKLLQLMQYTIARHHPDLRDLPVPEAALALLRRTVALQSRLVAQWMAVGFIHGVMNTDNMALSGETIDYGPCAFMDAYDPATVFSSIDRQGRYAYGNQPGIARWNLARFAETLLPFLDPDDDTAIRIATEAIDGFSDIYEADWLAQMRPKLGLTTAEDGDFALAYAFLKALEGQGADYTNSFRALGDVVLGDAAALRAQVTDPEALRDWQEEWQARLARDPLTPKARAAAMNAVNPLYIPRNHLVEGALAAAKAGDMAPFDLLLSVLSAPFAAVAGQEPFAQPAPDSFANFRTFCGT
ncbi:YdiU family protein [Pseudorhodobacter sp. E13]|uniref:protein adenylyltransferase SelO n=1 Tax=Pseudorhodobacter sp. E13 TaxID=2487931 RepID=UPI000F8E43C2|nr:YdiU family protein [Pseudorhodobacter sp. E13]RUS63139.1 YdiU family protein [Pseudorhodobacter sp. E13]